MLWSNDLTTFDGSISARGAGEDGAGGFAEVSGKDRLIYGGLADLRAPGGDWGTLLLDPRNISIAASPPPSGYSFNITPGDITTALQTTNLTLSTSDGTAVPGEAGDIRVFDAINWSDPTT